MFSSESLLSRLAQPEKCEFTTVNDHFEGKHNADSGLYGQTLISDIIGHAAFSDCLSDRSGSDQRDFADIFA